MRQLLTAAFVALACTVVQPAMAQDQGPAVPIERAPYHLPVFTNEYVTVLNVYVPPQRNTGYHTHSRDSVSVNIEDADMTKLGEFYWQDPGVTRTVRNSGTTRVEVVEFELK